MTGKVFAVVIGMVALIIIIISLPAIPDAVEAFRTDVKTQSYIISTGVGVTSVNVSLSNALWNSDVASVDRLSSNITADSAVASVYTVASQSLTISGLAANSTRVIALDYRSAGLSANPAADTTSTFLPGIVVGMVILVPLLITAGVLVGKR